MKLVRLITLCLHETYSEVRIGKNCQMHFVFRMDWNRKMFHRYCFSTSL